MPAAPELEGMVGVDFIETGGGMVAPGLIATGEGLAPFTSAGLLSKGAPTAISQRCPGLPCSGFKPFPATVLLFDIVTGACFVTVEGVCVTVAAGLLSKGAPTAISQRCPGLPCSGLRPAAVVAATGCTVGAAVGLLITGERFALVSFIEVVVVMPESTAVVVVALPDEELPQDEKMKSTANTNPQFLSIRDIINILIG